MMNSKAALITAMWLWVPALPGQVEDQVKNFEIKHPDGKIIIQEGQLFGRGAPQFRATLVNQLAHAWDSPKFEFTLRGERIAGKVIEEKFVVSGMCMWNVGKTCTVLKLLDFAALDVGEIKIEIVGGLKILTASEQAEEDRKKREAIATQRARMEELRAKEAESRKLKEKAEAEEAAKVVAGCRLIYSRTANKRIVDLTVKESQQVQACQTLGLYPPPQRKN